MKISFFNTIVSFSLKVPILKEKILCSCDDFDTISNANEINCVIPFPYRILVLNECVKFFFGDIWFFEFGASCKQMIIFINSQIHFTHIFSTVYFLN